MWYCGLLIYHKWMSNRIYTITMSPKFGVLKVMRGYKSVIYNKLQCMM